MSWLVVSAMALSARAQSNAAKADEIQLEMQAEQEELAAEGQELARRQQLNRVLAANVVSQATSGATGEGTPAAVALESAKQASLSEGINDLSAKLRQAQLRRQAEASGDMGNYGAAATLLRAADRVEL